MRKLGIDFGTKKVGLALSDPAGMMAFPHSVVPNNDELLQTVLALVTSEGVDEIVIGHSLNTDGTENSVHALVTDFVTDLTLQHPIPVHLEPEQFSTQQAIKSHGKSDMTDAAAAAIILESYLARTNKKSTFAELDE